MSTRVPCITALAALALLCAAPRHAPAQTPDKIPVVRLRFLFLDESPGAYSLKTGPSTYRRLSATPYAISHPVEAGPDDRLEIFKELPAAPPEEKTARVRIATVTPPAGATASLVVITPRPAPPDAATPPAYHVAFFDSDPRAFPEKSIRIINLGRATMAAMFGAGQVIVPPGASRIVRPVTDRLDRVFGKVAVQTPSGWKLLYNTITIVRPDERLTGVLVYSESGLRYTYTAAEIAENGPPPPGHFWLSYAERD